MTILYIICGASCFVSLANLVATLFLSNALFRVLVSERDYPPPEPPRLEPPRPATPDKGLVEVSETPTYDPRFRS
jgi:hypothetical protein